ncbi:putative nucleoside-diphosphate-sugar epimerase [Biscogniauxia marginata]|nr:putative nucleoside-diphosphate-sugar epimerase [Biscogniauxia marginata]
MSEILVITCPGGKQCSFLLPLLYEKGKFKLRLAAHSQSSTSRLQSTYPNAEVQQCDLTSPDACHLLLHGATAVFHVGPSLHSQEKEIGFNMVDAAVAESQRPGNNFKHFVFSSVLGTQHRNLMQHDLKSRIEERLFLSPLDYTILQPTNFMAAYPIAMLAQQEKPVIERLWNPFIPNSVIALRDLAEAAAKVLNEREKHFYAQYPLCSTLPVSDAEIAAKIGEYISKEIEVKTPSFETGLKNTLKVLYGGKHVPEDFRHAAEGDSRPDLCRDGAERLVLYYNRRGLRGNPSVLRWLLGREPTTVEEYLKLELQEAGLSS